MGVLAVGGGKVTLGRRVTPYGGRGRRKMRSRGVFLSRSRRADPDRANPASQELTDAAPSCSEEPLQLGTPQAGPRARLRSRSKGAGPDDTIIAQLAKPPKLVDDLARKHPDMVWIGLHVAPPRSAENIIVASNVPAKIGQRSDPEDLQAMKTGRSVACARARTSMSRCRCTTRRARPSAPSA